MFRHLSDSFESCNYLQTKVDASKIYALKNFCFNIIIS